MPPLYPAVVVTIRVTIKPRGCAERSWRSSISEADSATLACLGRVSRTRRDVTQVLVEPHPFPFPFPFHLPPSSCPFALIATFFCDPRCGLFVLAIHPDLFDYTMSQDPDDPSTSTSSPNSQTIFADALKQYKKRTKKDIAAHSLAAQIESCDSSNAVLTVLQAQVQTFDPSPSANERWTRSLHPTIKVLCAFSGFVSNIAGPVNCETLNGLRPIL